MCCELTKYMECINVITTVTHIHQQMYKMYIKSQIIHKYEFSHLFQR